MDLSDRLRAIVNAHAIKNPQAGFYVMYLVEAGDGAFAGTTEGPHQFTSVEAAQRFVDETKTGWFTKQLTATVLASLVRRKWCVVQYVVTFRHAGLDYKSTMKTYAAIKNVES